MLSRLSHVGNIRPAYMAVCFFLSIFASNIQLRTSKNRMKQLVTLLLVAASLQSMAQNPIIHDQYAADPTARLFGDRVYLYPSHDIPAPEGQRQDWFCMADYHVFSSSDLVHWVDHGVIISQEQVPWGKPDGYSMWAPDCVYKDGKYYFYFPDAPRQGRGFAIGVATADSPTGPFVLEPEPIKGVGGIDPCVLVDLDGQAYIYWSGMGLRGARLKSNMKELEGEQLEMAGLPKGFKEGPFVFRRGDWYYLTFPWVRGDTSNGANPTETLAYAMSHSPLGPWDFKGIIMAEHANRCWTNHHSFLELGGQWYLFYHRNDYSPSMDKRRSPRIEYVSFNADGTIREVIPTERGVGFTPATDRIEVDRHSALSAGAAVALHDTTDCFRGWYVTLPAKGWVTYSDVDMSAINDGYVVVCAKAQANTTLVIRERNKSGKVLARLPLSMGGEGQFRHNQRGQWQTLTAPLSVIPSSTTAICIVNEGGEASVDWLQFKNRPRYFMPVAEGTTSSPDDEGFLRRWHLLEPISKDIRSNTVFTDSWLRRVFAEELALLPKRKGKWHVLETENYNMRLFRFAEKWGRQVYGNLFWATCVIDCPEDLVDVRLAAGSNGASLWWIDNREVLLLSGDRRMVKDDGMSGRLTLSKGRHEVRVAVINGPGLSDMCVRLLDKDGKPVTNYQIK